MKTRTVHTVLHTPITMLFVERRLLFLTVIVAVVVALNAGSVLGLATLVLGYGFAFWTRDDPTLLTCILRATQTRTHYDAAAYQLRNVEIH